MSRYIDADAVKIRYRGGFHDDYVVDYDSFMKAPSIEIPTWIPCSEKMPERSGEYLLTLDFKWGRSIEVGLWADGMWWNDNSHVNVAWMPLPEPWKGADNE